jgi:hypothetical protein
MPFNPYDHNASYTDIPAAFLAESRRNLLAAAGRIDHCLAQLTDAEVWWRANPDMNAIGNLLLHLVGNVGQWIVAAVDNSPSGRDRPAEFAHRDPTPKADLQRRLRDAVGQAAAAIGRCTAATLLEPRRIQGNDTTVLTAIYHSVAHFEGHAQEIIAMTRQIKGKDYEFLWRPRTPEQVSAKA